MRGTFPYEWCSNVWKSIFAQFWIVGILITTTTAAHAQEQWRSAAPNPPVTMSTPQMISTLQEWRANANTAHFIIRFDSPVSSEVRSDLDAASEDIVGLYAVFQSDVSLYEAAAVATQQQALVRDRLETVNALVVELPVSEIQPLTLASAVQWLEPPNRTLHERRGLASARGDRT